MEYSVLARAIPLMFVTVKHSELVGALLLYMFAWGFRNCHIILLILYRPIVFSFVNVFFFINQLDINVLGEVKTDLVGTARNQKHGY